MLGALIILVAGSTLYLLLKPLSVQVQPKFIPMKKSRDQQKLFWDISNFSLASEDNRLIAKVNQNALEDETNLNV